MKIIATCRTRNEEANIERFCLAYGTFCDEIIIVDGGSEDETLDIASSMPKTQVYQYLERVYGENDLWRNPHGEHINWCITMAEDRGADWVIFDDCDDVPNVELQNNARRIFEETEDIAIAAYRLYIYGDDRYFPKMNLPGQSLWAWNVNKVHLYASEEDPWKHEMDYPVSMHSLELPLCLLHYFALSEERVLEKIDFYVRSGQHPNMIHPKESNGPLQTLPDFARWK